MLLFEWLHQLTFHQQDTRISFSHISASICYLWVFFDDSYSDRCEVVSCCSLEVHFPE